MNEFQPVLAETSSAIYQRHLDEITDALMADNFDAFVELVHFPFAFITPSVRVQIKTREEMGRLFAEMVRAMKDAGITHYTALVRDTSRDEDGEIHGEHMCHMLRGTTPISDPLIKTHRIKKVDGVWKALEETSFDDSKAWNWVLTDIGHVFDYDMAQAIDPLSIGAVGDETAQLISSGLLRQTSAAFERRDFDIFLPAFQLPNHFATFDGSYWIQDQDELKRMFVHVRSYLDELGVDNFTRRIVAAEFTSDDTIATTYVTEIIRYGKRIRGPYPVHVHLQNFGGAWKIIDTDNAIEKKDMPPYVFSKIHGTDGSSPDQPETDTA